MAKSFDKVKDSGKRQEFDTGARRDTQEGKGRFDLLPVHAVLRLAKHFENGAVKYGDNNWRKGIPLSRYLDSLLRHAFKFMGGLEDEDHLSAIIWNACCLLETQEMINRGILPKELDNLPAPVLSEEDFEEIVSLLSLSKESEVVESETEVEAGTEEPEQGSQDESVDDFFENGDSHK